MEREIVLEGQVVPYMLRLSKRAKRISLTVHGTGDLVVSLPHKLSEKHSELFLLEQKEWVLKNIKSAKKFVPLFPTHTTSQKELYMSYARLYVDRKITEFNSVYEFTFNKITVKDQKSQWGSCTHKKNLNINYKLIFLPKELAEYVIVHELSHLKVMNHSKDFWEIVATIVPNYKKLDKELSRYHLV